MNENPVTRIRRGLLQAMINHYLVLLAEAKDDDAFYQKFDVILKKMERFAGSNKEALETVRTAFQKKIPITEVARILIQKRLSKRTREQLARNFFVDWVTQDKKRNKLEQEGFKAPWFFVLSPTYACNLNCYGCYAHEYKRRKGMSSWAFDRILREAKKLGIRFVTISGGEPFYYLDQQTGATLFDLAKKHKDMFFQVYTNGTLLNEGAIERLAKLGNTVPCISQEGFEKETDERRGKGTWKKICQARENLHNAGVLQGFSVTVTRENADVVTSDEFIEDLISREVSFGWYFIYIPIGKTPAVELMPTPEQRIHLRDKIWEWRSSKPIFIGDFWNDGPWVGGCIAGGRKYFHINALGDIEPCVFVHFAVDNIYELWDEGKGLREAITSPFFESFRKSQLGCDNWCTPCRIIGEPNELRDIVENNKAYPTHRGAETIIQGEIAEFLDGYSKRMRELTWEDFQRMKNGEYDTPVVKLSRTVENHLERNEKEYDLMFGE